MTTKHETTRLGGTTWTRPSARRRRAAARRRRRGAGADLPLPWWRPGVAVDDRFLREAAASPCHWASAAGGVDALFQLFADLEKQRFGLTLTAEPVRGCGLVAR